MKTIRYFAGRAAAVLSLLAVAALLCSAVASTATAQERVKDRNGVVKYTVWERNDGSVVVKDNNGRIVRIIRQQNNGSTTYSDASGVVVEKEWPDSQRDAEQADTLSYRR